jgi:hypothetical protein
MQVDPRVFPGFLEQASIESSGDPYELKFGHYLSERFPNYERFWRIFVVPLTRRVDGYPNELTPNTGFRQSVAPELQDVASAHYSMFVNLVYVHQHLETWRPCSSSLEDSYVHLASACDLAETVLEKWYLTLLACRKQESHILQKLSRDEFLDKAREWYDENYPNFCKYYLSKGKSPPIKLLSVRANLLAEYLGDSEERKDYAKHSQSIRQFRNVVVHNVKVGKIAAPNGKILVPKPTLVHKYRSWHQVANIANNWDAVRDEFVEPHRQSREDTEALERLINRLWERMIDDFEEEFYSDDRTSLRGMFSIEFSPDVSAPTLSSGKVAVTTPGQTAASGLYSLYNSGRLSDTTLPSEVSLPDD